MYGGGVNNGPQTNIKMRSGELWKTRTAAGCLSVSCLEGAVWVTQEHDRRDIVLTAGDRFAITRRGLVVAQSLTASTISVTHMGGTAKRGWLRFVMVIVLGMAALEAAHAASADGGPLSETKRTPVVATAGSIAPAQNDLPGGGAELIWKLTVGAPAPCSTGGCAPLCFVPAQMQFIPKFHPPITNAFRFPE